VNLEQIYKAWHAVGADIAGLKWEDFVKALAVQPAQQQKPLVLGSTLEQIEDAIGLAYEFGGPLHERIKALVAKTGPKPRVGRSVPQSPDPTGELPRESKSQNGMGRTPPEEVVNNTLGEIPAIHLFEDLLGQYWDLAYLEGASGESQGDKANEVLSALRNLQAVSVSKPTYNRLRDDYNDLLEKSRRDARIADEWRAHVRRCQLRGVDLDHNCTPL
jgi:hypothetical protein